MSGLRSSTGGVRPCEDPGRLQRLADTLSAGKIDALLRKWLRKLPHPLRRALDNLDKHLDRFCQQEKLAA